MYTNHVLNSVYTLHIHPAYLYIVHVAEAHSIHCQLCVTQLFSFNMTHRSLHAKGNLSSLHHQLRKRSYALAVTCRPFESESLVSLFGEGCSERQQIGDILDLIWLGWVVDFFTICFLVRFPRMQRISRHFSHGKRPPKKPRWEGKHLAASLPRMMPFFGIPEFEETSILVT